VAVVQQAEVMVDSAVEVPDNVASGDDLPRTRLLDSRPVPGRMIKVSVRQEFRELHRCLCIPFVNYVPLHIDEIDVSEFTLSDVRRIVRVTEQSVTLVEPLRNEYGYSLLLRDLVHLHTQSVFERANAVKP